MRDRIARYARSLEGLSLVELSQGAEKLVSRERRLTAALIAHLAEIRRRKGHLELGDRSLFQYSQERLGLSDGQVWSRTQLANVSRRFPQVLEYLVEGKASLSSLGVLAPHLTEENVETLLAQAEGKTKEEVKEIVTALRPKSVAEPTVRRKPQPKTSTSAAPQEHAGEPPALPGAPVSVPQQNGEPPARPGKVEAARPEIYNFRFSAGKDLKAKLERLAEVLGIENATRCMPELIERALDLALEKKDPKRKLERRRKREAPGESSPGSAGGSPASSRRRAATGSAGAPPASSPRPDEAPPASSARSRYIPSAVREHVFERASYQCEYTGPDGVRCTARAGLQIDHIDPIQTSTS